jgi:hypothetical protein
MKYICEIKETLSRLVTVEATSIYEAKEKVQDAYDNEDIVLSADDFVGYEIEVLDEAPEDAEVEI